MENTKNKGIFVRIYDWFKNLTVKGLLGAILVAFIIIIILLSLSHLPGIMSRISSSLSAALYSVFVPAQNASVTADKKIISSGEDFTVTFKNGDTTGNGLYTLSYACDIQADLTAVENAGLKKINCDTPYYLLGSTNSLRIRANTSSEVVRLVLTGAWENSADQKVETVGVIRVTITNNTTGLIPEAQTSTTTINSSSQVPTTPTYNTPTYYGKPDLATRILQVGLLSNGANLISSQTQFTYSDTVGIRFEVRNDGDANTGPWNFTAVLPSLSTPTYNSNTQVSLRPGESIVFTLGFSNLTNQDTSLITINVDPQNIVQESVEYNNIVTSTITNMSAGSNHYYNGNYNNNNYNTGCYINGVFTYNCYNNYNYNYNTYNNNGYYDSYGNWHSYYNYYNYNNLNITCYADPNNPNTDERVHWSAEVYGGDGDYEYDWTGTNSLNSSSENPSKTYSSSGWKYATVTVTDGDNNEASATCSVYVD